jgi:hypothetical protein
MIGFLRMLRGKLRDWLRVAYFKVRPPKRRYTLEIHSSKLEIKR